AARIGRWRTSPVPCSVSDLGDQFAEHSALRLRRAQKGASAVFLAPRWPPRMRDPSGMPVRRGFRKCEDGGLEHDARQVKQVESRVGDAPIGTDGQPVVPTLIDLLVPILADRSALKNSSAPVGARLVVLPHSTATSPSALVDYFTNSKSG